MYNSFHFFLISIDLIFVKTISCFFSAQDESVSGVSAGCGELLVKKVPCSEEGLESTSVNGMLYEGEMFHS